MPDQTPPRDRTDAPAASPAATPTPPRTAPPPLPDTMTAVVQGRYGPADVWSLAQVARPEPGAGEVLVRVRAAGLSQGVGHVMAGQPYVMRLAGFGIRRPATRIPGMDLSGEVVRVGPGVTGFAPGDPVFGVGTGTLAGYAVIAQDQLAPRPPTLGHAEAAATIDSAATAREAVQDVAGVQAGQSVLVIGASGGVGHFAVQIAAAAGAEVTGVASGGKADLVRGLGAARVIDYTREDIADGGHCWDVILDIAGNRPLGDLRRALAPEGTLVLVGGEGGGRWLGGLGRQLHGALLDRFVRQKLAMLISMDRKRPQLEALTALVTAGTLRPAVHRIYPLAEANQAMADLRAGRVRGKAVIGIQVAGET